MGATEPHGTAKVIDLEVPNLALVVNDCDFTTCVASVEEGEPAPSPTQVSSAPTTTSRYETRPGPPGG